MASAKATSRGPFAATSSCSERGRGVSLMVVSEVALDRPNWSAMAGWRDATSGRAGSLAVCIVPCCQVTSRVPDRVPAGLFLVSVGVLAEDCVTSDSCEADGIPLLGVALARGVGGGRWLWARRSRDGCCKEVGAVVPKSGSGRVQEDGWLCRRRRGSLLPAAVYSGFCLGRCA